ncbi:MAG: DUF1579 family protein [Acidimicrobiales bacterium]
MGRAEDDDDERGGSDRLMAELTGTDGEGWGTDLTTVLEAMDAATARPETDVLLERLIGTWDVEGSWVIRVDRPPVKVGGRTENRWILFGRFVQSDTFPTADATEPSSTVIFGYDPRAEDYFAFAVNALNRHYDIEHGAHDVEADALLLRGDEVVLPGRRVLRFVRTVAFVDPDRIDVSISFPDEPDQEKLGGIEITWRRRTSP